MPVTTPTLGEHLCSNCSKPATSPCAGCRDAMNDEGKPIAFYYCDRGCQAADWPQHRQICVKLRARRELQRAAETLQQIWYAFRAEMFPCAPPVKVEERDGALYLYDSPDTVASGWRTGRLPDGLAKEDHNRKAVLVLGTCVVAVMCLDGMIRLFLKDLCAKIEELAVSVLPARPIKGVDENGNVEELDTTHLIILATLKTNDKEVFALDLTGAQYGHYEAMLPKNLYGRTRTDLKALTGSYPLGTRKALLEGRAILGEGKGHGGHDDAEVILISNLLDWTVEGWCKQERTTLSGMLKLPAESFRTKQRELVHVIGATFRIAMDAVAALASDTS